MTQEKQLPPETPVVIQREPFDSRRVAVPLGVLDGFRIDRIGGGYHPHFPFRMLCAYMSCADLPEGEDFGHTGEHGPCPHRIKVCITKKYNEAIYPQLRALIKTQEAR